MTSSFRYGREQNILVLGTADWDSPIATNQHFITESLAKQFHVDFVEGYGTRRLRLTHADLKRLARRTLPVPSRQWRRPRPPTVQVISPRLIPRHVGIAQQINQHLLKRMLRNWIDASGPRILLTYTPFTYGLEELADIAIYHLVDLIHKNPDVNPQSILRAEERLAHSCTWALATSEAIADHLRTLGFPDVRLLHNVGNTEPFLEAVEPDQPRDGLVFIGALSPWKLDYPLLRDLALAAIPSIRITLVGPRPSAATANSELAELKRLGVSILPQMPQPELARIVARHRVGLIPYAINGLTAGVSPLKVYEYLAAGIPVVTTPLPAVSPIDGAVHLASGEEFIAKALQLAIAPEDSSQPLRLQEIASGKDWQQRGLDFISMMQDSITRLPRTSSSRREDSFA